MSTAAATRPLLPTKDPSRYYLPELDTLRFFAFLSVFLHHSLPIAASNYTKLGMPAAVATYISATIDAGCFGVDLFFLLSSFLITTLLLREQAKIGRIDIKGFWIRRCLRIWPLYFFFVVLAGFILPRIFHFVAPPEPNHVLGLLTFTHNWSIAFSDAGRGSPTLVLWSVSLEEQFYFLWPLVIAMAGVARLRSIAIAMIVVAVLARIAAIAAGASWFFLWSATPLRMEPIAVGALIALAVDRLPAFGSRARIGLLAGGAAIMILAMKSPPIPTWQYTVIFPLVSVGCAMVFLAFYRSPWLILRHRALVYLGKISYGLYVYHSLAIAFSPRLSPDNIPLGRSIAALLLTVGLAAVSYHYLEAPFLRLKSRFAYVASRPA